MIVLLGEINNFGSFCRRLTRFCSRFCSKRTWVSCYSLKHRQHCNLLLVQLTDFLVSCPGLCDHKGVWTTNSLSGTSNCACFGAQLILEMSSPVLTHLEAMLNMRRMLKELNQLFAILTARIKQQTGSNVEDTKGQSWWMLLRKIYNKRQDPEMVRFSFQKGVADKQGPKQ